MDAPAKNPAPLDAQTATFIAVRSAVPIAQTVMKRLVATALKKLSAQGDVGSVSPTKRVSAAVNVKWDGQSKVANVFHHSFHTSTTSAPVDAPTVRDGTERLAALSANTAMISLDAAVSQNPTAHPVAATHAKE